VELRNFGSFSRADQTAGRPDPKNGQQFCDPPRATVKFKLAKSCATRGKTFRELKEASERKARAQETQRLSPQQINYPDRTAVRVPQAASECFIEAIE